MSQKEPEPLRIFVESFGGLLYSYVAKGKGGGITYWRWVITTDSAVRFLEAILPYSVLKAERIKMAVEFHAKLKVWNEDYGRRGYPDFVLAERERYFEEMKVLNQRSISAANPNPKTPGPKRGGSRDVISEKMAEKRQLSLKSALEKEAKKETLTLQ